MSFAHLSYLKQLYEGLADLRDHTPPHAPEQPWLSARLAAVVADIEFVESSMMLQAGFDPLAFNRQQIAIADLEDLADVDELDWSEA